MDLRSDFHSVTNLMAQGTVYLNPGQVIFKVLTHATRNDSSGQNDFRLLGPGSMVVEDLGCHPTHGQTVY